MALASLLLLSLASIGPNVVVLLAECLRDKQAHLKVLFLSGYTDRRIVQHSILEVEVAFRQKPFAPGLLALTVGEVLMAKEQPGA